MTDFVTAGKSHGTTRDEPRTVADYQLVIDFFGAMSGKPGTVIRHLGVVSEEAALAAAREAIGSFTSVWRVEIWSRAVPVEAS